VIYDLAHININCTDIQRSIAFYEKFGFEVIHVIAENTGGLDPSRDVMEGAAAPIVNLAVPLVADAGVGTNWDEAH